MEKGRPEKEKRMSKAVADWWYLGNLYLLVQLQP